MTHQDESVHYSYFGKARLPWRPLGFIDVLNKDELLFTSIVT